MVRADSDPAVGSARCRVESTRRRGRRCTTRKASSSAHGPGSTAPYARWRRRRGCAMRRPSSCSATSSMRRAIATRPAHFFTAVSNNSSAAHPVGHWTRPDRVGVGRSCARRCRRGGTPARRRHIALRHAGPWFLIVDALSSRHLAVRRGTPMRRSRWCGSLKIRELHDRFAFVYALVPLAAAAR